jgi:hypothetical protein
MFIIFKKKERKITEIRIGTRVQMYPAVEPVKVRREKVRGNDWNEISVY